MVHTNAFRPTKEFVFVLDTVWIRHYKIVSLSRFSINFTLDKCPIPSDVAYHFRTSFDNNTVVHNCKTEGVWNEEIVEVNNWIHEPGIVNYSILKYIQRNQLLTTHSNELFCSLQLNY